MTYWTLSIDGNEARYELPLISANDGGSRSVAEGYVLDIAQVAARTASNVQIITAAGKLYAENVGKRIVRCSDGKVLR